MVADTVARFWSLLGRFQPAGQLLHTHASKIENQQDTRTVLHVQTHARKFAHTGSGRRFMAGSLQIELLRTLVNLAYVHNFPDAKQLPGQLANAREPCTRLTFQMHVYYCSTIIAGRPVNA